MAIEFDPKKDALNVAKHSVSLARAVDFDPVLVKFDRRFDYGEQRVIAYGFIDGAAYCLCYVERSGTVRAISLRRARLKELSRNVQENKNNH